MEGFSGESLGQTGAQWGPGLSVGAGSVGVGALVVDTKTTEGSVHGSRPLGPEVCSSTPASP